MPRISTFDGIVIAMYYRDHAPPHFTCGLRRGRGDRGHRDAHVLTGYLPTRALRLVRDWAEIHDDKLTMNRQKARAREPLDTIEPLA